MNNWWILASLLLLLVGCAENEPPTDSRVAALPFYNEASFTPQWITPGSDSLTGFHQIPPFSLLNQHGDTVTERTVDGKLYVANFFFTSCPGICPKMTANMTTLQEYFRGDDELLLLSHSVTPGRDSVPRLRAYAEGKGIDSPNWHLLTGELLPIYNLGRQAYFIEENLGMKLAEDDFLHTENFVLVDRKRRLRGIYNGLNKASVQQLIADINALRQE